MRKKLYGAIGFVAVGLLTSSLCVAETPKNLMVAEHCREVSRDLLQLAVSEKVKPCTEKKKKKKNYLNVTYHSLWQDNIAYALKEIKVARMSLIVLTSSRECSLLASQTIPYLNTVTHLENEIQALDPHSSSK